MKSRNTKELNRFFKDYNNLRTSFLREKKEQIEVTFDAFFNDYVTLKSEFKERNKKLSSGFNVFELLRFNREEEQLHSQILMNFLNPSGQHGQGTLFYQKFIQYLQYLAINPMNSFLIDSESDLNLTTEKGVKSLDSKRGRIDLLIDGFSRDGKRFSIIIENKWDAKLSSYDQLYRYYKSILDYGIDKNQVILIYLTKRGESPDKSFVSKDFLRLQSEAQNHRYFNLSYEYDIVNWLKECLQVCESSDVETAINHYIQYLKNNL